MTDYIPTTDQVKASYVNYLGNGGQKQKASTKEFAKWLTQTTTDAATTERQRIIDLLEAEERRLTETYGLPFAVAHMFSVSVKLIKDSVNQKP